MNWYCIHTRPQKESQVKQYLMRQLGLEVFYPRLKQTRRHRRRTRVVVGPLFPRYLFCHFDPDISFRAACYAPEVIGVVSFGGVPHLVDQDIIENLRTWATDTVDVITIRTPFLPGERVEILDGPLSGLHAIVMAEMPDQDRVAILLEAMGCGARMMIGRSSLERAV